MCGVLIIPWCNKSLSMKDRANIYAGFPGIRGFILYVLVLTFVSFNCIHDTKNRYVPNKGEGSCKARVTKKQTQSKSIKAYIKKVSVNIYGICCDVP